MEIEEKAKGNVTVLYLKGRMAGNKDGERLREAVDSLVESSRLNIVLDMTGVPDIDSACLGEILHCHIRATQKSGSFRLANVNEKLRTLLTRTKIAWIQEDLLSEPPS